MPALSDPELVEGESKWTVGESNSRLRNANAMPYHCANGPRVLALSERSESKGILGKLNSL